MIQCRSCSADNPEESKFCSECGAALSDEYAPTEIPVSGGESSLLSSSSDSHHGRFLPGTKIADRYRIVSLVGKGGMGEVYRADDLKLGHTVALKFLPKDLADDPQRLEYFHTEVRLTRQISHPNVCRVYDIGEADDQLFLSMEYIDGEDLRILLRRIGKLPQDKGIQIAQQLCAGLAAAHDKGVLHRDLKPANIMLDGRGQVRITDFGLAKLADEGTEGEIAGTPAYMAPEQLAGGQVTIQSDLYSLGLILYELFTGEAARKPGSIPELLQSHEESSLSQMLEFPSGIDPAVQRAIVRCLEQEPHERPISATAVAASLPGGDPLAAALAAGETPSPELVAASGESGLLSLRTASIYLAVAVAGLCLFVWQSGTLSSTRDLQHSTEVFKKAAGDILSQLGHEASKTLPDYEKYQFVLSKYEDPENTTPDEEVSGAEKVLEFWYRRSPEHIFLQGTTQEIFKWRNIVTLSNPPPLVQGMTSVLLDRDLALRELCVVSGLKSANARPLTNISTEEFNEIVKPAFDGAKLPLTPIENSSEKDGASKFEFEEYNCSASSEFRSPFPADEFFVFKPKPVEELSGIGQIELALADGKIVYFKMVQPSIKRSHVSPWQAAPAPVPTWAAFRKKWSQYKNELEAYKIYESEIKANNKDQLGTEAEELQNKKLETKQDHVERLRKDAFETLLKIIQYYTDWISWTVSLLILPVTMVLAWRNTVHGRSDRRVAWRVAVFMFWVALLKTQLNEGATLEMFRSSLQISAGVAFRVWIYYLALEPILRKFWPGCLTVWSRAMTGRWRDPSLGRTLLVSAMMGTFVPLLYVLLLEEESRFVDPNALSGNVALISILLQMVVYLTRWGLYVIIVLVLCRYVVRRDWVSLIVAPVILITFWQFKDIAAPNRYTIVLVSYYTMLMFLLLRLGIVATLTYLFCHHLLLWMPFSDDLKGPDVAPTILAVVTVLSIAGYGFYTSVGGRSFFAKLSASQSSLSSTS